MTGKGKDREKPTGLGEAVCRHVLGMMHASISEAGDAHVDGNEKRLRSHGMGTEEKGNANTKAKGKLTNEKKKQRRKKQETTGKTIWGCGEMSERVCV